MATIIQRKAKLIFDISNSVIKKEDHPHPFRVVIKTAHGQEHTIIFGGDLATAQASRKRFVAEFYALRRAFVPRKKPEGSDLKFLNDED